MSVLDDLTDAVSDAVDEIGDAGDLIGGVLKTVSPILAAIPGVGTAFSVAIYAAGAIAAKDKITDAMIGTASAAMPPGVPRIAFDGAVAISKDVVEGRSVLPSAIDACRQTAEKAGGAPAVAAFDSGVAAIKGERIDQRAIDQARAFALTGGGQAAAASFDAGVAIARGKAADQVVIDVARGYINQMGGPTASGAFDTAIALSYGKTLQEAGYIGLHTFVKGNDGIEKVLNFVEQVGRARNLREGVEQVLESDLATDFLKAVGSAGVTVDDSFIDTALKPYVDEIRSNADILGLPAGQLAKQWGIDEAVVRTAQSLMRSGDGAIDGVLLAALKSWAATERQGRFDMGEKGRASNDLLAARGQAIIASGAKWRGLLVADIRKGHKFTITHLRFDAVSGTTAPATDTWEITDEWRRLFDVGIGAAEGTSRDNPEQVHANAVVQARLGGGGGGIGGFIAAEAIQYERTRQKDGSLWRKVLVSPSAATRAVAALPTPRFAAARESLSSASASVAQAAAATADAQAGATTGVVQSAAIGIARQASSATTVHAKARRPT